MSDEKPNRNGEAGLPGEGGSYVRQPDGSLKRVAEATETPAKSDGARQNGGRRAPQSKGQE